MTERDLNIAVQDAMTRAFASKDPRVRQAYMDLATFFANQLARENGDDATFKALFTR